LIRVRFRSEASEELNYAPNEQTPYTGWVKEMHDNGQINYLFQFKGGERDGLSISWYDNGQKWSEGNFKDGKRDGLGTRWYEDGQKKSEENFKDGKRDGLGTRWYEDGQKKSEENFKDGKPWTAIAWKPNGEKCPVTKLIDGNGVWVFHKDDGTEWIRWTFKDGEEVRD
jgi:antitoxin component YwqK of YwqJK toxin-antitoxin module